MPVGLHSDRIIAAWVPFSASEPGKQGCIPGQSPLLIRSAPGRLRSNLLFLRLQDLGFISILYFSYILSSNAVVLHIENGILKGAKEVNVNGSLYDVSFQDGTCESLFNGCNEASDFFFPVADASTPTLTNSEAALASQALLDQVFTDSALGSFDSSQFLTFGCNNGNICAVHTPVFYVSNPISAFHSISADNWSLESLDTTGLTFGTPITSDFSPFLPNPGSDTQVFALWSNSVTTVPVPTAVWLFGSSLIGLMSMRKNHKTL